MLGFLRLNFNLFPRNTIFAAKKFQNRHFGNDGFLNSSVPFLFFLIHGNMQSFRR